MKRLVIALAVAAAVAACAGCGPQKTHPEAGALASSTAVRAVSQDFQHCIPASSLAQVRLAHALLTDTRKHPNGSWAQLLACAGITREDQKPFENQALNAAESAHPSLASRAGRRQYFTETLPAIAAQYARAAAAAPKVSKTK